jgi:hypothetical protein
MADARDRSADEWLPAPGPPAQAAESPADAFRAALARYQGVRLQEIRSVLGLADTGAKPQALPTLITDHLGDPRLVERTLATLGHGPRLAAGLFAVTETHAWSFAGLSLALSCLGVDPVPAVRALAERGLLAVWAGEGGGPVYDLGKTLSGDAGTGAELRAAPALRSAVRTVRPEGRLVASAVPIAMVRETDGLEPVIRLAAVWQRLADEPLRQTQHGATYKRDRERLEDDPVLAGPIADTLEPLPDMVALWLTLAREVGLVVAEAGGDRLVASPHEFWVENAVHLPQMIAAHWLALRGWHEQWGLRREGSTAELASPYLRPAVLLWLATLADDEWVSLEALSDHLKGLCPSWDLPCFLGAGEAGPRPARPRSRRRDGTERAATGASDTGLLEAMLLGAAYQLGLVRAGEEAVGGRRAVQLTPLGRYVLALGPPPPPRPAFEHFLFVQPNFEMIAYRQGLTPGLVGQFSRFARWSQAGAALELKLTPESVYRGLEGGLTPEEMIDRLSRHSQRALPAGVADALRNWAGRRERVTYHAAATLIEFATPEDLERALRLWPGAGGTPPALVSDRMLLVEDESAIPFQRFRLTGSRDYRRPGESCVEVEADGVTLSVDLARSDLLVDAELGRFTEELPADRAPSPHGNPRRRYVVTPASLARGFRSGLTSGLLAHWYQRRTGGPTPPAVRLMELAAGPRVPALTSDRPVVLHAPSAEVLDGLLQHPATRPHLGDRLGPTDVIVPEGSVTAFRRALDGLGLSLSASDRPQGVPGAGRHQPYPPAPRVREI